MEDGAGYHQGVATTHREQYQHDGWQGWGPGTWLANSPDLNPLDNLWHLLRTNVKKWNPKPMKKDELVKALKEEWAKLDIKIVYTLINSMPQRMQAEGVTTHY